MEKVYCKNCKWLKIYKAYYRGVRVKKFDEYGCYAGYFTNKINPESNAIGKQPNYIKERVYYNHFTEKYFKHRFYVDKEHWTFNKDNNCPHYKRKWFKNLTFKTLISVLTQ